MGLSSTKWYVLSKVGLYTLTCCFFVLYFDTRDVITDNTFALFPGLVMRTAIIIPFLNIKIKIKDCLLFEFRLYSMVAELEPFTLKKKFDLGVGGEGQETTRHFECSFDSKRAILPM